MSHSPKTEITQILHEWKHGDDDAREKLVRVVYDTLKRQAPIMMSRERSNHTLQPTALVHEAFMKMGDADGIEWQDRAHFFGFTSRIMRQILVDHARFHAADKRGNSPIHFSTDDIDIPVDERADSILAVDEVLNRLAVFDERQARIVEMKFFGGMTNSEIAEALDISERTAVREWQFARMWLSREFGSQK
ncbi:MAG: sigma-70 family RNA polymerase sigma factor [Acidobacteria bacterium]|nr:sigma-70 family RNA polymerase sigma factor [Acidobacteriota bacterium]